MDGGGNHGNEMGGAAILTKEELKSWAWDWANRMHEDISLCDGWFAEVKDKSKEAGKGRLEYETALCWAVTAYYEFLRGEWDKERAEGEFTAAVEHLEGAKRNLSAVFEESS